MPTTIYVNEPYLVSMFSNELKDLERDMRNPKMIHREAVKCSKSGNNCKRS
jgi:hypothetical protein